MCFVDLQKEFDRVKLQDVLPMLQDNNIPNQLITVIENTKSKTTIQTQKELSKEIKSSTGGIRQGDSVSPIFLL